MTELQENLKIRLAEMNYGQIQVVAMIDRGAYPDEVSGGKAVSIDKADSSSGASKALMGGFASLATDLKAGNEDLITVQRKEANTAMQQEDIDWFISQLTSDKHLIFLQCLDLGTTEIKNFLYALADRHLLADSKVFLLDLPQLEYMTLRGSLAGKIAL
jgi:hypothetical protein